MQTHKQTQQTNLQINFRCSKHLKNFLCLSLCLVAQSCLTLCKPMTVAHQALLSTGIFQARILEWVAMPSSNGSSQPRGIKPRSPALQVDSLLSEPPGKPKYTAMGSLSFSRGSSQPRNQTGVTCIAGGFFTS